MFNVYVLFDITVIYIVIDIMEIIARIIKFICTINITAAIARVIIWAVIVNITVVMARIIVSEKRYVWKYF